MRVRINPYGILLFFTVFFLLIVIAHNFVVPALIKPDNMISLLYVRKDNIANTFQSEIYPVAIYTHAKYVDASMDVSDYVKRKPQSESYLMRIRDFFVIDKGRTVGTFHVDDVSPSPFMCSSIMTGKGTLKVSNFSTSIFDQIGEDQGSHSKGYYDKKEFDYDLKWSLAVSQVNRVSAVDMVVTPGDLDRYKSDLMSEGNSLLEKYVSDDGNEADSIILDKLSVFDLDHDGKPEVSAKLRKTIRRKSKVSQGAEEKEDYSNDVVYLNLWLTYKYGSPKVILSIVSYEREGSWGRGADLVGTLDVNGDGIEEVIMRESGWELVEYVIYEYRNDMLTCVFRGARYGC